MPTEQAARRRSTTARTFQVLGIALLLLLLALSLGIHLSYPLLWGDEAETAMFGSRILTYGYPKIHHQQRIVYCDDWPNAASAIDAAHDAYTGTTWGHFYVAAIGLLVSKASSDIYTKTLLIRLPFALLGFAGIMLLLHVLNKLLPRKAPQRYLFLMMFMAIELLSIPLVLHLREARYYSLLIFLFAALLSTYCHYRYLRSLTCRSYGIIMTGLLVLIFNTFYPAYVIIGLALIAYEALLAGWQRLPVRGAGTRLAAPSSWREAIIVTAPVLVSGLVMLPLFSYYHVFQLAQQLSAGMALYQGTYWHRLASIVSFFRIHEFFDLMLALQAVSIVFLVLGKGSDCGQGGAEMAPLKGALFFCSIIGIYCVLAALSPVLFQRYYILLQPLVAANIALNAWGVWRIVPTLSARRAGTRLLRAAVLAPMIVLGVSGIATKLPTLKGHVDELRVPYRGQLDYIIPYLLHRYPDASNITIATNYEEMSYMFYLNARTVNINAMAAVGGGRPAPDVIIYRRSWGHRAATLHWLLAQAHYEKVSFPIVDDKVNNCPEIDGAVSHRYTSDIPARPDEQAVIYCKLDTGGKQE